MRREMTIAQNPQSTAGPHCFPPHTHSSMEYAHAIPMGYWADGNEIWSALLAGAGASEAVVARSCSLPSMRGHGWRSAIRTRGHLVRRARRAPRVRVRPADLAVIAPRPARGRPDRPAHHHTHSRPVGTCPQQRPRRQDVTNTGETVTRTGRKAVVLRRFRRHASDIRHRMSRCGVTDRWFVSSGRTRGGAGVGSLVGAEV